MGREGLLVGLKSGQVAKIFIDNPFPIELVKHTASIRWAASGEPLLTLNRQWRQCLTIHEGWLSLPEGCEAVCSKVKTLQYSTTTQCSAASCWRTQVLMTCSGSVQAALAAPRCLNLSSSQQQLAGFCSLPGPQTVQWPVVTCQPAAPRCLDLSSSRQQLAVVDDSNIVHIYDLAGKGAHWEHKSANSVAWNLEYEDMLCFSGEVWSDKQPTGQLSVVSHAVHRQTGAPDYL